MKNRLMHIGIASLVLSGCVIVPLDFDEDD
jgi:hypothetical protein